MDKSSSQPESAVSPLSPAGALQFLLFVDQRSYPKEIIQDLQQYIAKVAQEYYCKLDIVELKDKPHLVEHYKLIVTPALVKVYPPPEQVLMGSNLTDQLEKWFPRWKNALEAQKQQCLHFEQKAEYHPLSYAPDALDSISMIPSGELLRLSDEVFRLKQEKEDLMGQIRFKNQMLSMVAHDLRNPLTAISIAIETLIQKEDALNQLQPHLKERLYHQAQSQLKTMNRLIGELLATSRDLQGKWNLRPQPFDLRSLSAEILQQFVPKVEQKHQTLVTDIPQDLPFVYGDQELIQQVILNLLDNAVKYTPQKGKITFALLHRTTQKIQVTVEDTGLGIPEEKQKAIFERNVRLDRDTEKEGYGLGLALCRKIIQAHYGQIWVDSFPHQGSSFHFTLPIYR